MEICKISLEVKFLKNSQCLEGGGFGWGGAEGWGEKAYNSN